jgi:hypothetical protein
MNKREIVLPTPRITLPIEFQYAALLDGPSSKAKIEGIIDSYLLYLIKNLLSVNSILML